MRGKFGVLAMVDLVHCLCGRMGSSATFHGLIRLTSFTSMHSNESSPVEKVVVQFQYIYFNRNTHCFCILLN